MEYFSQSCVSNVLLNKEKIYLYNYNCIFTIRLNCVGKFSSNQILLKWHIKTSPNVSTSEEPIVTPLQHNTSNTFNQK